MTLSESNPVTKREVSNSATKKEPESEVQVKPKLSTELFAKSTKPRTQGGKRNAYFSSQSDLFPHPTKAKSALYGRIFSNPLLSNEKPFIASSAPNLWLLGESPLLSKSFLKKKREWELSYNRKEGKLKTAEG
eukprot:CAMPEP_0204913244 /NCGR_PEP_ID=MMETSP1397-20131031/11193_1 /ASSEMBLY_ACC=CAM_ASM_000891 /TAXON_ID=49980 /ORGANISM="Climacostomum Climacostomum virens, Strain Stock W-24" /LENGTH=132 /DNA_ID=CAMNT_0052084443 /DNA_START=508 /DNA_END=907 /DNA_ORIENTATION=+